MKALLTFSLAISSATLADLVLHSPEKRQIMRPISETCRFAFQALGILIVVASCLLLFSEASSIRLAGSSLISFLTLLLWWNTNSYNPTLNPTADEFDGNPSTALGSTEDLSDQSAESNKYQY